MIVVTGGAGFIGSGVVKKLNEARRKDIIIVDNLGTSEKWKNLVNLKFTDYIHKAEFIKNLNNFHDIEAIFHLGACSSTTEIDAHYLYNNNFEYSRKLAEFSLSKGIRFIYASSAATYGSGEFGYSDDDELTEKLRPLNRYGFSKLLMDKWILRKAIHDKISGLRFFNVFGPNEYHKGSMRSMVIKAYEQIKKTGKVKLFKSNDPDYADGEQKRDFVYLKDAIDIVYWLYQHKEVNGIFNVGSGNAITWNALMEAVFSAMKLPVNIKYIEMPKELKGAYQNYTCADMKKLRSKGYKKEFYPLSESVRDYLQNYVMKDFPYL